MEGGKRVVGCDPRAVSLTLFFPLPSRTPPPQPTLQSPSQARGRGQVGTYLSRVCYRSSVHQTRHSPPQRPRLVWLTTSAGSPSVTTSGTACRASVPHASTGRAPCAAPRRAGTFSQRVIGVFIESKIVTGSGFKTRYSLSVLRNNFWAIFWYRGRYQTKLFSVLRDIFLRNKRFLQV